MNDSKRERIAMLAILARDKQLHMEALGRQNIAGLDAEEAERRQIAYSIAQAEFYEAKAALDQALLP